MPDLRLDLKIRHEDIIEMFHSIEMNHDPENFKKAKLLTSLEEKLPLEIIKQNFYLKLLTYYYFIGDLERGYNLEKKFIKWSFQYKNVNDLLTYLEKRKLTEKYWKEYFECLCIQSHLEKIIPILNNATILNEDFYFELVEKYKLKKTNQLEIYIFYIKLCSKYLEKNKLDKKTQYSDITLKLMNTILDLILLFPNKTITYEIIVKELLNLNFPNFFKKLFFIIDQYLQDQQFKNIQMMWNAKKDLIAKEWELSQSTSLLEEVSLENSINQNKKNVLEKLKKNKSSSKKQRTDEVIEDLIHNFKNIQDKNSLSENLKLERIFIEQIKQNKKINTQTLKYLFDSFLSLKLTDASLVIFEKLKRRKLTLEELERINIKWFDYVKNDFKK